VRGCPRQLQAGREPHHSVRQLPGERGPSHSDLGAELGGNEWAIIITFDEGITNGPNHADKFGNGGNIAFAVLGPLVHPATYATVSDHYGLLRTLEDGFGITTYLGNASLASPISTIWNS
jgi:hypothetical protein